jgi:NhaP-type Na+/H+ and K+/H+ antiporter
MQLHDFAGILGSGLILGSYFLLQLERMRADQLRWSAVNGLGAALVLASLLVDFNLGAFVLESAWLAVSVVGLIRALRRRSASRPVR